MRLRIPVNSVLQATVVLALMFTLTLLFYWEEYMVSHPKPLIKSVNNFPLLILVFLLFLSCFFVWLLVFGLVCLLLGLFLWWVFFCCFVCGLFYFFKLLFFKKILSCKCGFKFLSYIRQNTAAAGSQWPFQLSGQTQLEIFVLHQYFVRHCQSVLFVTTAMTIFDSVFAFPILVI